MTNQNVNNTCRSSEKYSFYRIPKAFSTDPRYSGLSLEAMFLYGLFLDRMSLSAQNGWKDREGRVYIYFRLEETMAQLRCGHTKAGKLFAELERTELIERRKQGMGKPTRIYVKAAAFSQPPAQPTQERPSAPFKAETSNDTPSMPNRPSAPVRACELPAEEDPTATACTPVPSEEPFAQQMPDYSIPDPEPEECWDQSVPEDPAEFPAPSLGADFPEPEAETSCIEQSGLPENSSQDFRKTAVYYMKSKTERNKTEYSISSLYPGAGLNFYTSCAKDVIRMDEMERCRERIRENIDYESLLVQYPHDAETLGGYVDLMAEVCCTRRDVIRIAGNDLPSGFVKNRFLKLDYEHIVYVLDCMKENTTHIRNIKAYTLAALYNAPLTMHSYYAARVNHDLYGANAS